MINRYLGNKQEILPWILNSIREKIGESGTVGDLCAGSLSVSLALKAAGYNVVLNDINSFSLRLGQAIIEPNEIHDFSKLIELIGREPEETLEGRLNQILDYLEQTEENPPEHEEHYRECYAPGGQRATGVNRNGNGFERRFFTVEVATRIDTVLGWIRHWHNRDMLSEQATALLLSCTMRAVEMRANTNGTFHESILTDWDERALKPFQFQRLDDDLLKTMRNGGNHVIGDGRPSEEYARDAPRMDLLYLDPPYNNRQYSDYYFMLNQIAIHHTIPDLEVFFANIVHQRGQNMNMSNKSALSKEATFLDTLDCIIENANCEWIIISYNNGKNHWGNFMDGTSDEGMGKIRDWIDSKEYLDSSSLTIEEHPRTNYQSRGAEAMKTLEYLISVRKIPPFESDSNFTNN